MKINDKHLAAYGSSKEGIDKEGFLNKRGEVNKGFQRRWFVLKGNLLFYFEKRGDKAVGVIILEDCTVEVSEVDRYCFTVSFFGDRTRVYVLSADSEDEMISWMKYISKAPFGYKAMVVKELERRLERLKKNEQEMLEKQMREAAESKGPKQIENLLDFEDDFENDSGNDLTDNLAQLVGELPEKKKMGKLLKAGKVKGNIDRNTIAGQPKRFNNLLTVVGAANELKNNLVQTVRRSKSSENLHKLQQKSLTTSPIPPRRKFHQSVMRKKAHQVKIGDSVENSTPAKEIPIAPMKSTFYVLHNRYAASIWTGIKEYECGSTEDLLKF